MAIKDDILKTLNWIKSKGYVLGVPNTAAAHNAIYRGDNLLSHFASLDALSKKVRSGDFSNIFIGDWFETTINSSLGGSEKIRWVVAGIDTYLHTGDTECTTHHLTMIAEDCFKTLHVMNPSDTTAGGFEGTQLWRRTLPAYNTALKNAIGAGHVLNHRELLSVSTNNSTPSMAGAGWSGASTGWAWHDAELMIPSEVQVYGSTVFSSSFYDVANRNRQLPYFAMRQDKLVAGLGYGGGRYAWWLSAVSSSTDFALVNNDGDASSAYVSDSSVAVRPLFLFA